MAEARQASGLSTVTLYRLLRAGKLEASKIGRRTLLSVPSLIRLIDAGKTA